MTEVVFFGALVVFMARNLLVLRFLNDLNDRVFKVGMAAIDDNQGDQRWRYEAMSEASQVEMVLKFWRPLKPEEWWADTSFLEPHL